MQALSKSGRDSKTYRVETKVARKKARAAAKFKLSMALQEVPVVHGAQESDPEELPADDARRLHDAGLRESLLHGDLEMSEEECSDQESDGATMECAIGEADVKVGNVQAAEQQLDYKLDYKLEAVGPLASLNAPLVYKVDETPANYQAVDRLPDAEVEVALDIVAKELDDLGFVKQVSSCYVSYQPFHRCALPGPASSPC